MKKFKFYSCVIIYLSGWALANGQQYNCSCNEKDNYNTILKEALTASEYINPLLSYTGDQYFNAWTNGDVLLTNGEVVTGILLRYERYLDELLWMRESDYKMGILNKASVKGFKLYNKDNQLIANFEKKKVKFPWRTDSTDVYLQLLAQGNLTLYVYRKVKIVENSTFVKDNSQYLFFSKGTFIPMKVSRSSLFKLPGINKPKMKEIISNQKLSIHNNEADLIKALTLYNQELKSSQSPQQVY